MGKYNRLPHPVAILGYREAYMYLCEMLCVDPHKNNLVVHVDAPETAVGPFSCVHEIEGAKETRDYNIVKSLALSHIKNTATAQQSKLGYGDR